MIYSVYDYDYDKFKKCKYQTRPRGNASGRSKWYYKNCLCAFDIETTRIKEIEQSIMYVWQFAVMWQDKEPYTIDIIMGRTWEEYKTHIKKIEEQILNDEKICIYVHNLSYEFQFLAGVYDFSSDNVFAIERRKVLKAVVGKTEYRCSYIHSNMSLAEYTRKMGVQHEKITNSFDYNKMRYPWTILTDEEKEYCINDVVGLVEALNKEMEIDNDNLYTIPLTSTGYVRRECKKAMREYNHEQLNAMKPTYEIWKVCREAFRGGNTHANRYYAGKIIENVTSYDRSSSYPDVILNCKFPMSAFEKSENPSFDDLIKKIKIRKRACIARIALHNVKLRDAFWGFPYLTIDKCRNKVNYINDNGRILSCDYCETTITDVDLMILLSEYEFDIKVIDFWHAKYDYLPKPIRDLNIKLYSDKTRLKGVEGQEIYYMKQKNKLNSVYGMSAQNPVKRSIIFNNDWAIDTEETDEEILKKYNKKSFLCYQWGVWVTAWARYRLEEGLRLAGNNAVYCDTDSVKYIGKAEWDDYNNKRKEESEEHGATAKDRNNKNYYMGVYEHDATYEKFVTLGAKKYAYIENGKLHITVAGVNKKEGASELKDIEKFKEGFIFREAGGTESVYNDAPEIKSYFVDGRKIEITRNIVIRESTYTLGVTAEYRDIIEKSKYIMEELQRKY